MKTSFGLAAVTGLAVLLVFGCSRDTPIRGQFLMKWEYVEILKGENGEVTEIGDMKAQAAFGGEGLGLNKQTQSLYVTEVGPAHAKFRLSDDKDANQEAVVEAATTQDIWLEGSRTGIRIRIESISPITKQK